MLFLLLLFYAWVPTPFNNTKRQRKISEYHPSVTYLTDVHNLQLVSAIQPLFAHIPCMNVYKFGVYPTLISEVDFIHESSYLNITVFKVTHFSFVLA